MNNVEAPRARQANLLMRTAVVALIAWLLLLLAAAAASQNMLFDGAMNLEVSRSLAEGTGPRRLYDFDEYFAHGVQTKEPYILVGALVFKLLGVGVIQAQLPNLVFLAAMCAIAFLVIKRLFDTDTALAVVLVMLATPMMAQYGLNGYGEVPSFAFGLAAIGLLAWPAPVARHFLTKCLAAGLLAGLSMSTKTVGAIQAGAIGLTLLYRVATDSGSPGRDLLRGVPVFVIGLALPLALIEAWKWDWLGTAGYIQWWSDERIGILYQAGLKPGAEHASLFGKVQAHFGILAGELKRDHWTTLGILALPLAFAGAFVADRARSPAARTWIAGLAAISACYVVWWLGVTPTEKAWLRRIYIGLLCLSIIGATAMAISAKATLFGRGAKSRVLHGLVFIAFFALYAPFVLQAAKGSPSFEPRQSLADTLAASRYVAGLDKDAAIFAYGWYAAPTVALQSGREFIDLSDWPIGKYPNRKTYLVADQATFATGALDKTLARYPHREMLAPSKFAQVYRIDFSSPHDLFSEADRSKALASVDFSKQSYPLTQGMHEFDDVMNGRWVESDSEILLRYDGQPELEFSGYMALPQYYRNAGLLAGTVSIAGCPPLPFAFEGPAWKDFKLDLAQCRLVPGSTLRVRILLDNTFDLPRLYDRQRAMLMGRIGFSGPAPLGAPARPE